MIKFIHCADIHIGMENYGKLNPQTGLNTRLEDFLDTLDESIEFALAEDVDLYVVAGDIYKTKDPTPTHQREFAKRIARLTEAGIKVFMIAGNHDIPLSPSRATTIDIFRAVAMPGVTAAREIGAYQIPTRSGSVSILAMPWMTRAGMLSNDEMRGRSIQQINLSLAERAHDRLVELVPNLLGQPFMVVAHCHMMGAAVGAERTLTVGHDPILPPWVFPAQAGYVALGHIHKHQVIIPSDPCIVYPGSINRVDFSEVHEPKGFIYGELGLHGCEWQFIHVAARPFVECELELDNNDPLGSYHLWLRNYRLQGEEVVKLKVKTSRAAGLIVSDNQILKDLSRQYFVLLNREITDSEVLQRPRVAGLNGKQPLEVLDTYLKVSSKYTPERRAELLHYAQALMEKTER